MKPFSTMVKYLIEDDVPLPSQPKRINQVYPIEKLKPGQSFKCPYEEAKSVRNLIARQSEGKSFTTKKEGDFLRIWRVK